jgi:hypothetical protein
LKKSGVFIGNVTDSLGEKVIGNPVNFAIDKARRLVNNTSKKGGRRRKNVRRKTLKKGGVFGIQNLGIGEGEPI